MCLSDKTIKVLKLNYRLQFNFIINFFYIFCVIHVRKNRNRLFIMGPLNSGVPRLEMRFVLWAPRAIKKVFIGKKKQSTSNRWHSPQLCWVTNFSKTFFVRKYYLVNYGTLGINVISVKMYSNKSRFWYNFIFINTNR